MSQAFKCDGCGELNEGKPNRLDLTEYGKATSFGWTNGNTLERAELCDGCDKQIVDAVREVLGDA